MAEKMNGNRSVEIDLARTLAIVMMVVYHIAFDLEWYEGWEIGVREGGWLVLQVLTATLFLLLVGISSALRQGQNATVIALWRRTIKRSAQILLAAMLVTVATYLWDSSTYIRFGILHCIGVTVLLLPILARLREGNLAVGLALIGIGMQTGAVTNANPLLLPLGITSVTFTTLDYYPLLPWSGIVLIGYAMGHLFYIRYPHWKPTLPPTPSSEPARLRSGGRPFGRAGYPLRPFLWPGQHPLLVYLIHQPIILTFLFLMRKIS